MRSAAGWRWADQDAPNTRHGCVLPSPVLCAARGAPARERSMASADRENVHAGEVHAGLVQTGLAGDGGLRWVTADVTPAVEYMRPRVDFSPVAAAAFGQALAGATLLAQR